MHLTQALSDVAFITRSPVETDITGIHYDSRRIQPGDAFLAMRGETTDGNRFIDKALAQGAAAIVTDSRETFDRLGTSIAVVLIDNGRRALSGIAANLLAHPERALKISAVTGTNGKTTTAFLLEQMLRSAGRQCVLLGTIETHVGEEIRTSEHTTPEASDLLRVFADGVRAGATEAVMEMSSHALAQERVWGVPVDVGIFTNLTQDHLDYHQTMDAYAAAKARLFAGAGAPPPRIAILNADDPAHAAMANASSSCEVWTYGYRKHAAYRAENIHIAAGATTFDCVTPAGTVSLQSPLTGWVNVSNLLAASCAALARGLSLAQIAAVVPALRQVPGRFETVPNALGFTVVVDYAHTDDALRNLIGLARELVKPTGGRVLTLFGCGGDRDKSKRPKMGRAAGEGSDLVILTSDNPRREEPVTILNEALAGVRGTTAEYVVIEDRRTAIAFAIRSARSGDIVLITGKGHEKGQIVGDQVLPFDDVAVAAGILQEL